MTDRESWIVAREKALLDRLLCNMRGNDLLQIGLCDTDDWAESARTTRTFFLDSQLPAQRQKSFIQGHADCLPIQSETMDIVLLLHQLDAVRNPMDVLQETYRVLRPNGQLIVLGWNRWSVWNSCHRHKKLYSAGRIKRCLHALNFELMHDQTACFWPPFLIAEALGQFFLPYAGSVYLLMATKSISGITPLTIKNYNRIVETRFIPSR